MAIDLDPAAEGATAASGGDPTIWVDADACPRAARELVMRAAVRLKVPAVFVANAGMRLPDSPLLSFRLVPPGADKADDHIAAAAAPGDLAVTDDIPLASRLVATQVMVVNSRGEELTTATIGERLAMRDLMDRLRSAGLASGGPRAISRADLQHFANALDRFLVKRLRQSRRPG